jgi:hypothetical protein
MPGQYKKRVIFLMLHFLIFIASAFSQTLTCNDVRNGVFISFSKTDGSKSVYTRSGDVQKELNTSTKETIFWNVEWINDCSYYLKYNSRLENKSKQELEKIKKHKFLIQILSVSQDYYVFQSFLDKESNPAISKDTLWIKQRKDAKNRLINNPEIDSLLAVRKAEFDASLARTATLYIYRPEKFAEGGDDCIIYYNDTAICTMTNKSAYIIRLLKEGPATFTARIRKQEMAVKLDVKYGEKYYLRCELKWAIPAKPILTLSDLAEARPYFDNVK